MPDKAFKRFCAKDCAAIQSKDATLQSEPLLCTWQTPDRKYDQLTDVAGGCGNAGALESTATNQYEIVHCDRHGDRRKAYVCDHLLHGSNQGFFTASDGNDKSPS